MKRVIINLDSDEEVSPCNESRKRTRSESSYCDSEEESKSIKKRKTVKTKLEKKPRNETKKRVKKEKLTEEKFKEKQTKRKASKVQNSVAGSSSKFKMDWDISYSLAEMENISAKVKYNKNSLFCFVIIIIKITI